MARRCLLAALFAALGARAPRAAPGDAERIAVLVLGATEADVPLADNVTEVIIAHVAQRRGVELAGTVEFRKRLGMDSDQRAQACLDDSACLGRAAVSLGVRRIVAGTVGARDGQFLFNLWLEDAAAARTQRRIFQIVNAPVENLIRSVREATDQLFHEPPPSGRLVVRSDLDHARVSIDDAYVGTTPLIRGDLLAGAHTVRVERPGHFPWAATVDVRAGSDLDIRVTADNLPRRLQWPGFAAYSLASASVIAVALGVVLGSAAQVAPLSPSRSMAQEEFEQHRRWGLVADIAFVSAGAFTLLSSYLFIKYRHHIFGAGSDR